MPAACSRWPTTASIRPSTGSSPGAAASCRSRRSTCRSSLRKVIRQARFEIRVDSAFAQVIDGLRREPAGAAAHLAERRAGRAVLRAARAAASRTASRPGRTAASPAASMASRSARRSSARACSRAGATPARSPWSSWWSACAPAATGCWTPSSSPTTCAGSGRPRCRARPIAPCCAMRSRRRRCSIPMPAACCRSRPGRRRASGGLDRLLAIDHPDVVDRVLERRDRRARGEHPAREQLGARPVRIRGRRQLADLEERSALRRLGRRRLAAGTGDDLERAEGGRHIERRAHRRDPRRDLVQALQHGDLMLDHRALRLRRAWPPVRDRREADRPAAIGRRPLTAPHARALARPRTRARARRPSPG